MMATFNFHNARDLNNSYATGESEGDGEAKLMKLHLFLIVVACSKGWLAMAKLKHRGLKCVFM